MSHISCIVCGLQKPLSSLDLENLDLDIYLIQKKGLGRGKGWEDLWRESVLGDDVYTPVFKERILEVLKFFLSEEIIKEEEIIDILKGKNLQIDFRDTFFKYDAINKEEKLEKYEKDLRRLRYRNMDLLNEIDDQKNENKKIINKYEKKLEVNKSVEFALCSIVKYFNCICSYKDLFDYEIIITDYDLDQHNFLYILNRLLTKEEWNELMKRVKGMDIKVQKHLDSLTYFKNKFKARNVNRMLWFNQLFSLKNYLDYMSTG